MALAQCIAGVAVVALLSLLPMDSVALTCYSCDTSNPMLPCYGPNVTKTVCQPGAKCLVSTEPHRDDGGKLLALRVKCFAPTTRPQTLCFHPDTQVLCPFERCCAEDLCSFDLVNTSAEAMPPSSVCPITTTPATSVGTGPSVDPTTLQGASSVAGDSKTVVVLISVLGFIVFVGAILAITYFVRRRFRVKRRVEINMHPPRYTSAMLQSEVASFDSGCVMGESSGRGILQLEERTISREIELREQIGTGRFGEVYRGMWRENQVAVKIFKTIEEASFFREVELFNTYMLRHENILGFQAADNRDFNMETQLWMVLDYHCNGSLYDYLRRHTTQNPASGSKWLGRSDLYKIASSMSAGLMHLHNHIDGQSFGNKPSIAHRDLKSKNILVKQNGTCCIADFGMAVRHIPSQEKIEFLDKTNLKIGTKRYMAPEILDDSINCELFESYRKVDIYALALVLWEVTYVCCPPEGELPTYKLPFEESVPGDPSVEEMYNAVCVGRIRPVLSGHWQEDKSLSPLLRIIRLSWKEMPQSRFAANRIWRNIQSMREDFPC